MRTNFGEAPLKREGSMVYYDSPFEFRQLKDKRWQWAFIMPKTGAMLVGLKTYKHRASAVKAAQRSYLKTRAFMMDARYGDFQ